MSTVLTTTIRFTPELHEELRVVIARRRLRSIQQAVEESLKQWMRGAAPAPEMEIPEALEGATKEELAWCGKLVGFLREGEPAAIDMVQHALNRHARQFRERRKQAGS